MKKANFQKEKLIDLKKVLAIIQKNFIVIMRDKARILPLILFPVFMIMVFGFTSGNAPKHIPAAVISYDHSPLSQQIQQDISNSQTLAIKKFVSTEGEGKNLLDSGKVKVLIVMPPRLEEKIDNGGQSVITVIVDESDSSVASTAKQAISSIIAGASNGISIEKISHFQNSVDAASQKLQAHNSQFADKYIIIISKSKSAEDSLEEAGKKISQQASSLENSLSAPTPIVAPRIARANESLNYFNQTYIPESAAYLSAKGQISVLKQSSNLVQSARENLHVASEIAKEQNDKFKNSQEYQSQQDNVVEPANSIKGFTSYNAGTMLKPLAYEEKPAYGTGKRNIDFLIPSIIALTIFQGAVMGMGRAVAGERREGSLTRVFLTPTSNVTIILGTLLFYIIFEILRSAFLILLAMNLFSIKIEGSLIAVLVVVVIYAGVSTAIGMLISSAVKTETQYFGMAMLVSMPTVFLAGAFFPIQAMPKLLQRIASFLPVTYAGDALRGIMIKGFSIATVALDVSVLLIFFALTLGACFIVFRRDIE